MGRCDRQHVGVTGYQIFRCQNAGCTSYALLASPTGTATTYKDTSVAASTAYGYEVRATDAAGNLGPFSNSATATTPASTDTTPPSAPGTLAAHAVSAGEIDLTWGAASDNVGVTGYEVFRCTGAACGSFTKVGQAGGGTTTYSDTGLTAATSYSYEVRALDAAGNTGLFSNTVSAATSPSNSSGVVAAYGFNEGTGTTVADASGNGNGGTVSNTTWAPAGKYGGALSFNGTNARVNIPSSTSLQLTNGMTLEAWVNPTTTSSAWRDIIYKGVDNYYLEGASTGVGGNPSGGGTFGGANANAFAPSKTGRHRCLELSRPDVRRCDSAPVRERGTRREPGKNGRNRLVDQSAPDRRRQPLRPVLLRSHRRGSDLQGATGAATAIQADMASAVSSEARTRNLRRRQPTWRP